MSRAQEHACEIINRYFSSRGKDSPATQAESFIRRVHINKFDNKWRSTELVNTAENILNESAFNIDDLVENFLGIDLAIASLAAFDAKAGSAVFGVAYPRDRSIVICERAESYMPLYRTTVAHELGHIELHGSSHTHELNYAPFSGRRPPQEYDADEFMQALLLPKYLLLLAIGLVSQDHGVSLDEALRGANTIRGQWQWRHLFFRPLIDRLCLSRHMLSVAMSRLGLFSGDTVAYHQTYALENNWRSTQSPLSMRSIMAQVWKDCF